MPLLPLRHENNRPPWSRSCYWGMKLLNLSLSSYVFSVIEENWDITFIVLGSVSRNSYPPTVHCFNVLSFISNSLWTFRNPTVYWCGIFYKFLITFAVRLADCHWIRLIFFFCRSNPRPGFHEWVQISMFFILNAFALKNEWMNQACWPSGGEEVPWDRLYSLGRRHEETKWRKPYITVSITSEAPVSWISANLFSCLSLQECWWWLCFC